MNLSRVMKGRTRFLYAAFSVFMVTFLLNVMVLRINLIESQAIELKNGDNLHEINREEAYENYIARGQRKPKAANENEYYLKEFLQNSVIGNEINNERATTSFQDLRNKALRLESLHESEKKIVTNENALKDVESDVTNEENQEYEENDEDEDEDYEEENSNEKVPQNKVFELGDFANVSKIIFARPLLKYQEVPNTEQQQMEEVYSGNIIQTLAGHQIVTDGIYWSDAAESLVPKGMTDEETFRFVEMSQKASVKSVRPPSWSKCGRPKNAYIVLDTGSSFCARYRDPHNKLVLGEVMSYYLSRLLGMDSVPAVFLAITNQTSRHWNNVDISSVEWQDGKVVALIQWTPHMETTRSLVSIPKILLKTYQSKSVIDGKFLHNSTLNFNEIADLVQWSAMILFDYITGHYDRFASMQDGAVQEHREGVLSEKVRNLLKSTKTNKLWFIDNESGLFDAYDLLYNTVGNSFIQYHKEMLQTICVFQKSMVDSITRLHLSKNPHLVLEGFAARHEPLIEYFSKDFIYLIFKEKFKDRISEVYNWIQHCKLKNQ